MSLINIAIKVLKIKTLNHRYPLVVTWPITNRCNLRCQYCERWRRNTPELETSAVLSIINQLKELGTIRISLSGGEPLVRDDIGEIINYAKSKGISVVLTSNGVLVPKKIEEIKNLDLLKLSIEGKERVHAKIRGQGSYQRVLEAAKMAQEVGLKFVFNSVLTAYNLDQIDFLLKLAAKFKTGVRFTALNTAHAERERIESLCPSFASASTFAEAPVLDSKGRASARTRRADRSEGKPTLKDYQEAVEKLIKAKKEGRPVLNSFAGLEYLRTWPKAPRIPQGPKEKSRALKNSSEPGSGEFGPFPAGINCYAGRAFAHLSAEGKLYPCVILEGKTAPQEVLKDGFSKAFSNLPEPQCSGCWCGGTLELNLLLSLKLSSILNLKRLA